MAAAAARVVAVAVRVAAVAARVAAAAACVAAAAARTATAAARSAASHNCCRYHWYSLALILTLAPKFTLDDHTSRFGAIVSPLG
jgi:hypothetical protein